MDIGRRKFISGCSISVFEKSGRVNILRMMKLDGSWLGTSRYWENERLRVINHQFKVKCKKQRASLAACKEILIPCSQRAENAQHQVSDLITGMMELQKRLNSQTWQVFSPKERVPMRKVWDSETCHLGECKWKFYFLESPELSRPVKMVTVLTIKW